MTEPAAVVYAASPHAGIIRHHSLAFGRGMNSCPCLHQFVQEATAKSQQPTSRSWSGGAASRCRFEEASLTAEPYAFLSRCQPATPSIPRVRSNHVAGSGTPVSEKEALNVGPVAG